MEENNKKKIVLIDGYHLLHKGYYGSLKRKKIQVNDEGQILNAVCVFVAKMLELIDCEEYHTIIVTFDVSGKECWRKKLYDMYKAKRKETPEELKPQMQLIRQFLTAANIPWYEKETFEGDDVMGTIARIANKLGYFVDIISNDKDIYQLVNENTNVITQKAAKQAKEFVCIDKVIECFGCKPCQIPDMKSLMGDSSDNIKGVKGLHHNTAQTILKKYGSIENVFKNINNLEKKHREMLERQKEQIILNKKLTTIQKHVDIGRVDFRKLNINYVGFMWFIRKQKMWTFAKRIKPLADAQILRRDTIRRLKENAVKVESEKNSSEN